MLQSFVGFHSVYCRIEVEQGFGVCPKQGRGLQTEKVSSICSLPRSTEKNEPLYRGRGNSNRVLILIRLSSPDMVLVILPASGLLSPLWVVVTLWVVVKIMVPFGFLL